MKNIELINASAGSGKTYSLTNRVIKLLNNGIAPEAMMATTFTNRAAAELRERIRLELLKNQHQEEATRIRDGFIGTVNSICGRLIKEYALEAGLSPAIEILPEEDSGKIFKISIDRVIASYGDKIEPAARRLSLIGAGSGHQATVDWRGHVKRIVDLARSNHITESQLKLCSSNSWETLREVLGDPVNIDLNGQLESGIKMAIQELAQIPKITITTKKILESLPEYNKKAERSGLDWSDWVKLSKLAPAKDGQDILAPVIAAAGQVLKHPLFQADLKQMIELVFECAADALRDYDVYKHKNGLMDFTDQEVLVLEMALTNNSFKASFRERIKVLMVDEFQDTSPIQLALFLALNDLAEGSVWVGDPKQAIYGFRGTDPQLMDEVVAQIGATEVLGFSWRSKENLVDFTNALFSEVFSDMGRAKVCLKIPLQRAVEAQGGDLEGWQLNAGKIEEEYISTARGLNDLIQRQQVKPGDVAILCRTNDNCTNIAANLEQLGIRASVGQGSLLDTQECRLALAALRYMNNRNDTLALTEINQILSIDPDGANWLTELVSDPVKTIEKWHNDDLVHELNQGREFIKHWTPLEALEQAIFRIDLLHHIKSGPNPNLALSNLDALRKVCREYLDQCSAHRSAATVDGLLSYFNDSEAEQARGFGKETVNVLTYHGAKGLEWPWVILTGLEKESKVNVFGVNIEAAEHFEPSDPLADRKIRFWPWPFGSQQKFDALDGKIEGLPLFNQAQARLQREEQRLLYVGMTRARDGMVLTKRNQAGRSSQAKGLFALTDPGSEPLIEFPAETGEQIVPVGTAQIPMTIFAYGPDSPVTAGTKPKEAEFLPVFQSIPVSYPAARISPSSLKSSGASGHWKTVHDFKTRVALSNKTGKDLAMDILGSAVHAYLALDLSLEPAEGLSKAHTILEDWGLEEVISPQDLVAAKNRFHHFINETYPGCTIHTEWPMSMRNHDGQVLQGWIDCLLETETGYVIIDHKNYPGQWAEAEAQKHIPQLRIYREAVEKATGKPVHDVLLHLPISGLILRLEPDVEDGIDPGDAVLNQ